MAAGAANTKGARLRRGFWRRVMFASLRGRRPFGPRIVVAPSAQFYRPPLGLLWHACHFSCLPTPSTAHAVPLPLQAGGGRLKVHKRPSLHKRGSAGASGDKAISITSPCTILMNQPPAAAFPPLVPVGTTFLLKGSMSLDSQSLVGSLRIQFLCHPASGGRTTRAKQRETYFYGSSLPIKKRPAAAGLF